jgi:hypothetical protein
MRGVPGVVMAGEGESYCEMVMRMSEDERRKQTVDGDNVHNSWPAQRGRTGEDRLWRKRP